MNRRLQLAVQLAALGIIVAACAPSGSSSPSLSPTPGATTAPETTPTPRPTPTSIGGPVVTLEEAAQVVIASDPRFAGVTRFDPNLIGASAWWEGEATAAGFQIRVTIGWGDCPAGCISKHHWTFDVAPDGSLTLVSESGDPIPSSGVPGSA
jgi:hypothetical protein